MQLIPPFRRPSSDAPPVRKAPLPSTDMSLEGPRVLLRIGQPTDWQEWRAVREANRAHLMPWEPTWPADGLSYNYYSNNLRRQWREWKEGAGYAFQVFLKSSGPGPLPADPDFLEEFGNPAKGQQTSGASSLLASGRRIFASKSGRPKEKVGPLIGGVALTHIERGAAQHGTLGYWIAQDYQKQGLMSEATRLVVDCAFDVLKLHRLQACCMPGNIPSRFLLTRLGFAQEGFAPSYLRINGRWEDHELWGMVG